MRNLYSFSLMIITFLLFFALCFTGCDQQLNNTSIAITETTIPWINSDLLTEAQLKSTSDYPNLVIRLKQGQPASVCDSYPVKIKDGFELEGSLFMMIEVEKGNQVADVLALLNADPGVAWAEANFQRKLSTAISPFTANDPFTLTYQHGFSFSRLGISLSTHGVGEYEISAAVIDTGLNFPHEEFNSSSFQGWSYFERSGTGDDVSYAYNFDTGKEVDFDSDTTSFLLSELTAMDMSKNWDSLIGEGHGSHVSGIIGALGNNGLGICGVCPGNLNLTMFKSWASNILNGNYVGYVEGSGSLWALYSPLHLIMEEANAGGSLGSNEIWKDAGGSVQQTVFPINMSFGWYQASKFESEMISRSARKGVLCIAAAGNSSIIHNEYPASYSEVLSVSAVDGNGQVAPFSSGSWSLSVAAPGSNIYSVGYDSDNAYRYASGTSMAAPFVTGLAAYALTFKPDLTVAQLRSVLEQTAMDGGAAGWDPRYGYGIVDVNAVIQEVKNIAAGSGTVDITYTNKTYELEITGTGASETEGSPIYLYRDGEFYSVALIWVESGIPKAVFSVLPGGDYIAKLYYESSVKTASFSVDLTDLASTTVSVDLIID